MDSERRTSLERMEQQRDAVCLALARVLGLLISALEFEGRGSLGPTNDEVFRRSCFLAGGGVIVLQVEVMHTDHGEETEMDRCEGTGKCEENCVPAGLGTAGMARWDMFAECFCDFL